MLARGIDLSRRHKQLVGWAKSPGPLSRARRVGERSPVAAGDRFCPRGPPTWARRARFFMRGIFGGARLSPHCDLSQMTCFNGGSYCGSIPASWITLLQGRFLSKIFGRLGPRGCPRLERDILQYRAHLFLVENRHDVAIDLLRNRCRSSRGCRKPKPGDRFEPWESGFRNGGYLGDNVGAPQISYADKLHLAVAIERHRSRKRVEEHIDVAGQHVGEGRLSAAIGYVYH